MFNIYNKIVFLTLQATSAIITNDQQADLNFIDKYNTLFYTSLLI